MAPRKRRDPVTEAAAAAAAAVAATQGDPLILGEPVEDSEVIEDVLEGLRRLDQGENRVTWYVYSQTAGKSGNSEGYIEKLRSEQLDEQRFKNLYGPGEYRIVGRTRDGSYVKGSHKVVRISDIGANGTAGTDSGDAVSLLREMRAADERRAQQRSDALKTTAGIVATPLATIVAALIARRPSIDMPALITALRPQQNTLTEMTTALASLKQLDGGGTGNVDMVLKLLERLQDLPATQGDSGWLSIIRDVIKEAVPTVREFVGQLGQQPRPGQLPPGALTGPQFGPGVPQPALPAAAPTVADSTQTPSVSAPLPTSVGAATPTPSPPPSPEVSTTEGGDMWRVVEPWLRRKAEDLHDEAASNMPVELSAEHLLTAAEKKFGVFINAAELHALLSRPDWWQFLVAFHPALEPFHAWVNDVRREILAMLEDNMRPDGKGNKPQGSEDE